MLNATVYLVHLVLVALIAAPLAAFVYATLSTIF